MQQHKMTNAMGIFAATQSIQGGLFGDSTYGVPGLRRPWLTVTC